MKARTVAAALAAALPCTVAAQASSLSVRFERDVHAEPLSGRLLILVSKDDSDEPRNQVTWGLSTAQVFGIDVEDWAPGSALSLASRDLFGFPVGALDELPAGDYSVQAVLHRYATFTRAVGPPVLLPASWEAGQQWNREPDNLYSRPRKVRHDPRDARRVSLTLDQVMAPIEPPEDTEYVRHVRIRSELLSRFWGRDVYLGAHMELALGAKGRSGQQFVIWEAVFSPLGEDGYPARLWDKLSGEIDMDNYYLNNAVYLMEEFLESTTDPYYDGVVEYGDRAEHCWNGDHENPNHISRLRYNTIYVPRILERIGESAPEGADITSWRY